MRSAEFRCTHVAAGMMLAGELDLAGVYELRLAMTAIDDGAITFDLSELTFIDSSGVAALLRLRRDHPAARIVRAPKQVRDVFRVGGVEDLLLDDLDQGGGEQ